MQNSYSVLAKFYDRIILDEDYNTFADNIVELVKKHTTLKNGLDLCCGSGIITRKLKKQNFNVVGVDLSQEMLEVAQNLSVKENLNVNYIKQDIKNLKHFEKVNFITIINDGINYIKQEDIPKTFKNISKCLVKDGTLIFDISTEYKLKNILGNNMFGGNENDLSFIWLNTLKEDRVIFDLTFFEKQNNLYKRYDESQVEYIHKIEDIKTCLQNSGFSIISVEDKNGEEIKEDTERAIFIAKKN